MIVVLNNFRCDKGALFNSRSLKKTELCRMVCATVNPYTKIYNLYHSKHVLTASVLVMICIIWAYSG